jgi:hypothetical protein
MVTDVIEPVSEAVAADAGGTLKPEDIGLKSISIVRKACRTCRFSEMEGKDRVCRLNPPQVTFMAVPVPGTMMTPAGPRQVTNMEVRAFTGFPIMGNDQFCFQYQYKGHGG